MVHHIPITEARTNLSRIAKRAHQGKEYFILEKNGIPVAGLMDVDELEDYLEIQNPELRQQIEEGYAAYRRGEGRDARKFLAELKRELERPKQKRERA
jgi:antitoxin (DNA-binding transcriptional repressor) of toxin-antitoxin stability system